MITETKEKIAARIIPFIMLFEKIAIDVVLVSDLKGAIEATQH